MDCVVSTRAVLVLASVPPIELLAEERKETFHLRKDLTCINKLREIAQAKEAIARMEGADSSRNGRRDGMLTSLGDGHTV